MRLVFIISIFFCFAFAKAQTYELGVFAGGSNIVGDVGSTKFIDPLDLTAGVIFKWNRSDRHSFRGSILFSNMVGDDNDSDDVSRDLRGYKYNYNLIEASVGIEYNFWEWELYTGKQHIVPYLYTGLTGFQYEAFRLDQVANQLVEDDTARGIAVPFILGIKSNIAPKLVLGVEVGVRYTFTDNLDGSNNEDFSNGSFGNINNNDWYVFSGVTLTYAFGRKPCYCNF
ncbi:MAG: DUF6089 family protein [Nonlabens sp.]|uniref:type IX secretion system protein PorG n=1 Tax=Nonlabens sp. TaxID=1888209 RepID=UPI003EF6D3AD